LFKQQIYSKYFKNARIAKKYFEKLSFIIVETKEERRIIETLKKGWLKFIEPALCISMVFKNVSGILF